MRRRPSPRINWCFTDHCEPRCLEPFPGIAPDLVRYLVAQKEVCPLTGKHHWQGYVQLHVKQRLTTVVTLLPGAHWEAAKGTYEDNLRYCTKEETRCPGTEPVIFGTPLRSGSRTDITGFIAAVKSGKRKHELVEEYASILCRHRHFYSDLVAMLPEPPPADRQVILHLGPSGLGKTTHVRAQYTGSLDFYIVPVQQGQSFWLDGYNAHKFVLLDEFAGQLPFRTLLRFLHKHPEKFQTKGGFTQFMPEIIYITSNVDPQDWYNYELHTHGYTALLNRLTQVVVWDEAGHRTVLDTREAIADAYPPRPRPRDAARFPLGESRRD